MKEGKKQKMPTNKVLLCGKKNCQWWDQTSVHAEGVPKPEGHNWKDLTRPHPHWASENGGTLVAWGVGVESEAVMLGSLQTLEYLGCEWCLGIHTGLALLKNSSGVLLPHFLPQHHILLRRAPKKEGAVLHRKSKYSGPSLLRDLKILTSTNLLFISTQ